MNTSANVFVPSRLPTCVYADRPLEIELAVGFGAGAGVEPVSAARWISDHARLMIDVKIGRKVASHSVSLSARPSGGGWIARALIRPASWADTGTITVVSLSLAGRIQPCQSLPATLKVFHYIHKRARKGAVLRAAQDGDVPALRAALDAGGSTEEADEVRPVIGMGTMAHAPHKHAPSYSHPALPSFLLCCRTAALPSGGLLCSATSRPSARSWRQAPTRPQPPR